MNFDKLTNRFNSHSLKWDIKDNELPMWVADMDFEVAPVIKEAMQQRLAHSIFGYNIVPEEYFDSIVNWWQNRHNYHLDKSKMMFCTGVVPAISSIVRKMTTVGENVLIQAPVYNIFYNSILNNGRNVLSSDLIYENGNYHIDWIDLENKLSLNQTTMMILCNPHNPVGKIWDKETLKRIGDLCYRHHVLVLVDEIHCDITKPGYEYVPFASVSETNKNNCITCIAPTKAFNIAGLQTSCIVVDNPVLNHKVTRGINTDEVAEPNSFAIDASIAAFNHGALWLDELLVYIQANKDYVTKFINENLDMLHVVDSDATYLLWIDCSKVCQDSVELVNYIRKETGLYLSDGKEYGLCGKSFIRMNVACSKERVTDGINRFKVGIESYLQNK